MIISFCLVLIFGQMIFGSTKFNDNDFYPNTIIVNFKSNAIKTTMGDISINQNNNKQIQIGIETFDKIAIEYNFINMTQLYKVKNKEWHTQDGIYPMNTFKITMKDNQLIEPALIALQNENSIHFAAFDPIIRSFYTPNDPLFINQWHHLVIQSEEMWEHARGDTTIIIAIVDSGVKWNHPDLRDNIYINWNEMTGVTINWNSGVIIGWDGIDNDENGYIDDVLGWNFTTLPGDNNVYQSLMENNHGTHVAGCAGAVGDNNIGVSGVAMNVKLLITRHTPDDVSTAQLFNPYNGILYAADNGAHIINCSWGGTADPTQVNMIIDYATEQGSLVVVAAGNSGGENINYPACATNTLSVAASNENDEKTDFSTFGTWVDMIAPGNMILSTFFSPPNEYLLASGTSMAAPIVSGAAAMVKITNPNLTPLEIKTRLKQTGDIIPQMREGEFRGKVGSGRLNAYRAIMGFKNVTISLTNNILIEEHDGDGDGVPNMNEIVTIKVELHNAIGAEDAVGLVGIISSDFPGVQIIQPELHYDILYNGTSSFSQNSALVYIPNHLSTLAIPFSISISSNDNTNYPFNDIFTFDANISMSKPNWPLYLGGQAVSAPKVANLDGSGNRFITVFNGIIHVVDGLKNYNQGFPLDLGANTQTGIAIGHLIGDQNTKQIVVVTTDGVVKVVNHLGQILQERTIGFTIRATPIIDDLDNDGQNEIIIATQNQRIYILNGQDLSDWGASFIQVSGAIISQLAVGDLNNDGIKNIVVNTSNPTPGIYALNPVTGENLPGFPIQNMTYIGPSLADLDNDGRLEIIIAGNVSNNCPIKIIKHDGTILHETTIPSRVNTEIAIVDLFNNGSPKLIFGDATGNLFVKNIDFSDVPGFPVATGSLFEISPVFATLDRDIHKSIIFGDNNGYLHIIRSNGQYATGYPIHLNQRDLRGAAWIGWLNNDNASIFLVNPSSILCIDTKIPISGSFWNSYRANIGNTACFNDQRTPNKDDVDLLLTNALQQNYPNPFNPNTIIKFSLKSESMVNVSIYNIKGQIINTLVNEIKKPGDHKIMWNGENSNNNKVASGLYFYKIETIEFRDVKKMILLK